MVINGTKEQDVVIWVDASHLQGDDCKSITGYIIQVGGSTIIWKTKQQNIVAQSSAESEYIALSEAMMDLKWVMRVYGELGHVLKKPVIIKEDNTAVIQILEGGKNPKMTKHLGKKYHLVKQDVLNKLVKLEYVDTNSQRADILTKAVSKEKLSRGLEGLGISVNGLDSSNEPTQGERCVNANARG
jgi:hypothetical protein